MLRWILLSSLLFTAALSTNAPPHTQNHHPYTNPILPGWHSDPSCLFSPSHNNTFFCTTSSFLTFPGCPIYASQDLQHWTQASAAVHRASQLPALRDDTNQQTLGLFASTLRLHNDTFYLLTSWLDSDSPSTPQFLLFTTTDPYNRTAWSDPLPIANPTGAIDPDFFIDADGTTVMAYSGSPIRASVVDLATGAASAPFPLWTGTGASSPEGPHLYRKDGWYYLLIAEGGTQLHHAATLARSRDLGSGSWEASPRNPLVSNAHTDAYFQTVGHADLFVDAHGNWWGVALATRGGPRLYNASVYPMGRETVLFPVRWEEGGWPVALGRVAGRMEGPLPSVSCGGLGLGLGQGLGFVGDAREVVEFKPGSTLPAEWVFWRAPVRPLDYAVSPPERPNVLRLAASRANLTGDEGFRATDGLTFVARRQTHSLFRFEVDVMLGFATGSEQEDEVGVTAFLNQGQHVDFGVFYGVEAGAAAKGNATGLYLRLRTTVSGKTGFAGHVPETVVVKVPDSWDRGDSVRLAIHTVNTTHFAFSASQKGKSNEGLVLGMVNTTVISGDGAGTGALLGVYATTNGGLHAMEAYISRWGYFGEAQEIDYGEFIPAGDGGC
ncbi:uncharacterized protein BO66DRAFT_453195 [Aspergillus aculeatinus CBS 121060]|uniref:Uncharacterized protein n=1 Tax=Aspergillus aculeatinus CBS 121060 TaxID=1448322 RepID=A0ACD1H6U6_9EURO|nr:hypothetical protein BO66DRAFT_453195 [Aspergillus aculeatinus CBS 121060]RAH69225.1 hypothetical protein BO66DRAFT_453195 [Aspergillus aculeatinus CBS 121060]